MREWPQRGLIDAARCSLLFQINLYYYDFYYYYELFYKAQADPARVLKSA